MNLSIKTLKLIDQQWLDEVVKLAEDTMKTTKVYGKGCRNGHWTLEERCRECKRKTFDILPRAQLSNLQNMANSTDSMKALELFIYYQMGRKEGRGWKYEEFGLRVINDLNELKKWAEQIGRDTGGNIKDIHLYLIRLYCGYLNRWFVALKGIAEEIEGNEEE